MERNRRLATRVASLRWRSAKNPPPAVSLEDFVADATEGLVRAAVSYDPNGGATFATWAWNKMDWAITDGMRRMALTSRRDRELGVRDPTVASLDAELRTSDGAPHTLADALVDPDAPDQDRLLRGMTLQQAIEALPERERVAIRGLIAGDTQATIGPRLGVTASRVSQLQASAVARMRLTLDGGNGAQQHVPTADGNVGTLTPCQLRALLAVADGEPAVETARRLHLSPHTVLAQRKQAFTRLGATNAAHAVAIAFRLGILR